MLKRITSGVAVFGLTVAANRVDGFGVVVAAQGEVSDLRDVDSKRTDLSVVKEEWLFGVRRDASLLSVDCAVSGVLKHTVSGVAVAFVCVFKTTRVGVAVKRIKVDGQFDFRISISREREVFDFASFPNARKLLTVIRTGGG